MTVETRVDPGDWADAVLRLATGSERLTVQGFIAIDREIKPAPCAIVARGKRLPLHGVTVAVPFATGSESHCHVTTRAIKGPNRSAGMEIVVRRADGRTDTFLWRHTGSGTLRTDAVSSDARLALVRTAADGTTECAALLDGRTLRADGVALKGAPGRLAEKKCRGQKRSL